MKLLIRLKSLNVLQVYKLSYDISMQLYTKDIWTDKSYLNIYGYVLFIMCLTVRSRHTGQPSINEERVDGNVVVTCGWVCHYE